jgi:choline dehydrogenase-like flavoprotein
MGANPATSVVRPDLRCHHVPNIWIASASTFPSSGSANPTLTILQLAFRAADALLRETSVVM